MISFSKRAQLGEQVMMFAFMFLLLVVGGGIVIGTFIFISRGIDFREGHAALLGQAIDRCVNEGFNLEKQLGRTDILSDPDVGLGLLAKGCGFNEEVLQNYFKIKICQGYRISPEDCIDSKVKVIFSYGDVVPCGFEKKQSEEFLGCDIRSIGEQYLIITATNQKIRGRT